MRRKIRHLTSEAVAGRILFMLMSLAACVIILQGVVALVSGSIVSGVKKIGASIVQSFYWNICANENHIIAYITKEETAKDTILTSIAENVPINYYAMHQGKTVTISPLREEQEDENIDWWLSQKSESEATSSENDNLTNFVNQENNAVLNQNNGKDYLVVEYKSGDVEMLPEYQEQMIKQEQNKNKNSSVSVNKIIQNHYDMTQLTDLTYLIGNYYIVDAKTSVDEAIFDVQKLLDMDVSIKKDSNKPQILIYHTHSSESYVDGKEGVQADTVVGVGNYLTQMLEKKGYNVYHDTTSYDLLPNGDSNFNYSYSTAYKGIQKILKENPSIQVTIDLHRDSGSRRVCSINGKDTAQVMFFNGLSRNKSGPIENLENENQQANLAFSLQSALLGRQMYPKFLLRNYLKNYRYNLHMKERSMLIEVGTVNNTVAEAYNAMEPLADILDQVLRGH